MVSFTDAIQVRRAAVQSNAKGSAVYEAILHREWTVIGLPHGGAILALMTNATTTFQQERGSPHIDPISLQASFLTAPSLGPAQVHVTLVKSGKRYCHFSVDLVQNDQILASVQSIYTTLPPMPTQHLPVSAENLTLLPLSPSPYAPITPMLTHPSHADSTSQTDEEGRRWSSNSVFFFDQHMKWSEDEVVKARRMGKGDYSEEKLELDWAAWYEFNDPKETMTSATLAFFGDIFSSVPELVRPNGIAPHYYPTMALSMQFFCSLPALSPYLFSPRTVGLYASGNVIRDGLHQQNLQVWSAPSPIGVGESQDDWRKRSMLLCTSTQVALSIPVSGLKKKPMSKI